MSREALTAVLTAGGLLVAVVVAEVVWALLSWRNGVER